MLAIFNKGLVDPPKELNSPNSHSTGSGYKPKYPEEIVRMFQQTYSHNAPLSMGFGNSAFLAYSSSKGPQLHQQRYYLFDHYVMFISPTFVLFGVNKRLSVLM